MLLYYRQKVVYLNFYFTAVTICCQALCIYLFYPCLASLPQQLCGTILSGAFGTKASAIRNG